MRGAGDCLAALASIEVCGLGMGVAVGVAKVDGEGEGVRERSNVRCWKTSGRREGGVGVAGSGSRSIS